MTTKPTSSATKAQRRDLRARQKRRPMMAELYRRAEAQLRKQRKDQKTKSGDSKFEADPQRLFHELQVHQVELEMQNAELKEARDRMEALLENYTDLYDFAPAGYFTLAADGKIQQVNLTGAHLAGIERSRLVGQSFGRLISAGLRPVFNSFLAQVFADHTKRSSEFEFLGEGQPPRTISIEAQRLLDGQECRAVVVDISERKRAEDEVHVSEVRYRRLFEAAHDGVLILDPATRKITDANPFMTKMLGYSHDQLIGKELFEIGLLKDEVASQEMFQKLKRKHEVRYDDLPLESQTGRHQEVEVVANLYQENGSPVIQCNIRDITARKRAEEALRQSEERYRTLFNSMDEGYCIIEMIFDKHRKPVDWRFLEVNPSFEKQNGLHDATGKLISVMVPDLEACWFEIYGKVALTGKPVRLENETKSLGGRWFDLYAFRVGGPDSRKVAVLFNNITARKNTEQELSEKARLLDLSHDAIIVRDVKGHIRYWNHGAEELYGWSRQEALGKICNILLHTEYPIPVEQITRELHRTNRWIGELVHTKRDGQRVTVLTRKTLDRDRQGNPASVLENLTDITTRKKAEEAQRRLDVLAASNRKLEKEIVHRQAVEVSLKKSEQHQRQLLGQSRQMQHQLRDLSHQILSAQEEERKKISRELHDEIAQTLAGINVRLGALKMEAGNHGRSFQAKINRTQRLVEKSVDIVHRFARDLRPTLLDDLGLIPALHAFVKTFTQDTGVRVRLTVFAGVEKLDNARRTVLYRVAQEALTNVHRHAKASAVEVNIQELTDRVCMTIRDDGQCPPMDPMRKAKRGKRLGLIGMRERLEMVAGSFEIQSVEGKGTTVRAEVPFGNVRGGRRNVSNRVRPS